MSSGRQQHTYSDGDKALIATIRQLYVTNIKEGKMEDKESTPFDTERVPSYVVFTKTVAKSMPVEASVGSARYWESQLSPTGICREHAIYLISLILEYQSQRQKDILRSSAIDDPTSLLFHEFKEWLVKLGNYSDGETELCLKEIDKRRRYLSALIASKKFSPGIFSETSRGQVFEQLEHKLDKIVRPYVVFIPNQRAARDSFRLLVSQSQSLLRKGIQALYLILRNNDKTPQFVSVYDALGETSYQLFEDSICRVMKTVTGRCLNELVMQCKSISRESLSNRLDFQNAVPMPELKSQSGALVAQDKPAQELAIELLEKSKEESGIDQSLFDFINAKIQNKDILKIFIELHSLLFELAKGSSLLEEGYSIAGIGGNLLLYGFLNWRTKAALDGYEAVLTKIVDRFNKLNALLQPHYNIQLGKRGSTPWRDNYALAKDQLTMFDDLVTAVRRDLSGIQRLLHGLDLSDLLKAAERKMSGFARMVQQYYNHLRDTQPDLNLGPLPTNWGPQVSVRPDARIEDKGKEEEKENKRKEEEKNKREKEEKEKEEEEEKEDNSAYLKAKSLWHKVEVAKKALFEILKKAIKDRKPEDLEVFLRDTFWRERSDTKSKILHQFLYDTFREEAKTEIKILELAISTANEYLEAKNEAQFGDYTDSFEVGVAKLMGSTQKHPGAAAVKQEFQSSFSSDEFHIIFTALDEAKKAEAFKECYKQHGDNYDHMMRGINLAHDPGNRSKAKEIIEVFKATNGTRENVLAMRASLDLQLESAQQRHAAQYNRQRFVAPPAPRPTRLALHFRRWLNELKRPDRLRPANRAKYEEVFQLAATHLSSNDISFVEDYIIESLCVPFIAVPLSYLKDSDCNTLMHYAMESYKAAKRKEERKHCVRIIELLYQNGADSTTTNTQKLDSYTYAGFCALQEQDTVRAIKQDETRKIWQLKTLEAKYIIAWSPLTEAVKERLFQYIDRRREAVEGDLKWFLAWIKKFFLHNQVATHDRLIAVDKLLLAVTATASMLDEEALMRELMSPPHDGPQGKKSKLKEMSRELCEKIQGGELFFVSAVNALARKVDGLMMDNESKVDEITVVKRESAQHKEELQKTEVTLQKTAGALQETVGTLQKTAGALQKTEAQLKASTDEIALLRQALTAAGVPLPSNLPQLPPLASQAISASALGGQGLFSSPASLPAPVSSQPALPVSNVAASPGGNKFN